MEEARWGTVFPGMFVPVLTLEGKCLRRRAKPAHLEGHLPTARRGECQGRAFTYFYNRKCLPTQFRQMLRNVG